VPTTLPQYQLSSHDRRTQAVLDKAAATVAQLDLDHALQQQITDHIFESSSFSIFRAVHTGDFIERLIEATPSLTKRQKRELREIASDLIILARKAPHDTYEQGRAMQQEVRASTHKVPAIERFMADLNADWEAFVQGLHEEWQTVLRWLRS
jgi:uncharacterized membrane-anchored protein YjiN (DUF445 family)